MNDIKEYNSRQKEFTDICSHLHSLISAGINATEAKVWHAHPVWFIDGNPIVGYSVQKKGVRLMFWSGASFDEPELKVRGEKFKDVSIFYNDVSEINPDDMAKWLKKSEQIQWDYKNIVKNKGDLRPLKGV